MSAYLQPLAKGAAEGVPFVGGVMAEMLALFWIPALESCVKDTGSITRRVRVAESKAQQWSRKVPHAYSMVGL